MPTSRPLLAVAALLLIAAACSDDQKRSFGEEDARDALAAQLEAFTEGEGIELDGDPECTATIGTDGAVAATCEGTGTSGEVVVGTFAGTADVDAEQCTADLAVTVDGTAALDEADVDCFAVDP